MTRLAPLLPGAAVATRTASEFLPCPTCGAALVDSLDAIGRLRLRCPSCDRVAPSRPPSPDECLVPQTLVSAAPRLPPVQPGQLRCQRCGTGVVGRARFCSDACAHPPRFSARRCRQCGASFVPARWNGARCDACRHAAPRSQRTYAPKRCVGCGGRFTPTGPRAHYCSRRCRTAHRTPRA